MAKTPSRHTEKDFPEFNLDALQILKDNIEQNLGESGTALTKPEPSKYTKKRKETEKKRHETKFSLKTKERAHAQYSQPRNLSQKKQDTNPSAPEPTKKTNMRLRNDDINVSNPDEKGTGDAGNGNSGIRATNGTSSSIFDLRKEIQALGGDEEDFDLVANAQSDSEIEGQDFKTSGEKFVKELGGFLQSLGIDKIEQNDADEPLASAYKGHDNAEPGEQESTTTVFLNGVEKANASAPLKERSKKNKVHLVCFLYGGIAGDADFAFVEIPSAFRMACD